MTIEMNSLCFSQRCLPVLCSAVLCYSLHSSCDEITINELNAPKLTEPACVTLLKTLSEVSLQLIFIFIKLHTASLNLLLLKLYMQLNGDLKRS